MNSKVISSPQRLPKEQQEYSALQASTARQIDLSTQFIFAGNDLSKALSLLLEGFSQNAQISSLDEARQVTTEMMLDHFGYTLAKLGLRVKLYKATKIEENDQIQALNMYNKELQGVEVTSSFPSRFKVPLVLKAGEAFCESLAKPNEIFFVPYNDQNLRRGKDKGDFFHTVITTELGTFIIKLEVPEENQDRLAVFIDPNYFRVATGLIESMAIHLRNSLTQLQNLYMAKNVAIHDPLTGFFRKDHLNTFFDLAVYRSLRKNEPLSIAMLDLDRFALFNDGLNHDAGDAALVYISQFIWMRMRAGEDFAIRVGGDEFCLIFPGMSPSVLKKKIDAWNKELAKITAATLPDDLKELLVYQGLEPIVVKHKSGDYTLRPGVFIGFQLTAGISHLEYADLSDKSSLPLKKAHEVMSNADNALVMGKSKSRGEVYIWDDKEGDIHLNSVSLI